MSTRNRKLQYKPEMDYSKYLTYLIPILTSSSQHIHSIDTVDIVWSVPVRFDKETHPCVCVFVCAPWA